jgi:hypothetical protein
VFKALENKKHLPGKDTQTNTKDKVIELKKPERFIGESC